MTDDHFRLDADQLATLDQVIAGMQAGEVTPTEVAQAWGAPPPPNQQQGAGGFTHVLQTAVGAGGAANIGLTVLTTGIFAGAEERETLPADTELPTEVTLDQLLELRRRATS